MNHLRHQIDKGGRRHTRRKRSNQKRWRRWKLMSLIRVLMNEEKIPSSKKKNVKLNSTHEQRTFWPGWWRGVSFFIIIREGGGKNWKSHREIVRWAPPKWVKLVFVSVSCSSVDYCDRRWCFCRLILLGEKFFPIFKIFVGESLSGTDHGKRPPRADERRHIGWFYSE